MLSCVPHALIYSNRNPKWKLQHSLDILLLYNTQCVLLYYFAPCTSSAVSCSSSPILNVHIIDTHHTCVYDNGCDATYWQCRQLFYRRPVLMRAAQLNAHRSLTTVRLLHQPASEKSGTFSIIACVLCVIFCYFHSRCLFIKYKKAMFQ